MTLSKAINNFIEAAKEWNSLSPDEEKIHLTMLGDAFMEAMVSEDVIKCNLITEQLKQVIQNRLSAPIPQDTTEDTTI